VTVSDHIQKVLKPNFAAAWEEVGDTFEKEETFALSSTKLSKVRTILLSVYCRIKPNGHIYYSRVSLFFKYLINYFAEKARILSSSSN